MGWHRLCSSLRGQGLTCISTPSPHGQMFNDSGIQLLPSLLGSRREVLFFYFVSLSMSHERPGQGSSIHRHVQFLPTTFRRLVEESIPNARSTPTKTSACWSNQIMVSALRSTMLLGRQILQLGFNDCWHPGDTTITSYRRAGP